MVNRGRSWVWGHSGVYREFVPGHGYGLRPDFKRKRTGAGGEERETINIKMF